MTARKEWFSAKELAGLVGMPGTERGCLKWLEKNLATSRRKVLGKGCEYSRDSLPDETREYLDAQDIAAVMQVLPAPAKPAPLPLVTKGTALVTYTAEDATTAQRQRQLARQIVVRTLRDLAAAGRLSNRAAVALMLEQARTGQMPAATLALLRQACDERGRKAGQDSLPSAPTLMRFLTAAERGDELVPRPSALPDLRVRAWYVPFFALTDRPQKPTLAAAHEQLIENWRPEWADPAGSPPPSYDACVRAYDKRSKTDRLKGRNTGSALRSKTFYAKRTYAGLAPFTEVHSDGWTTHFTAPHPTTGQWVTYEVWHFHDVATRFVTPFAIGLTENTDVILDGLRRCIEMGGVMAIWQTDHTSSVKNRAVMDEHAGLADRLGISVVHPAEVGNSQANGIAENFNTWLDREARELATYQNPRRMDSGTFVRVRRITNAMVKAEHSPAERDRLRREAMRIGKGLVFESHDHAVAWLREREVRWNNHPCRELPKVRDAATGRMVHMSPQQSLDAAIAAGWEPLRLSPMQLTEQFMPHLRKKVTRGTVSPYTGMRYHHADLAHHEGCEVLVAVDRDQPGSVVVKDLQGRLIARAELVEAVGSRTESMREFSERKRAEAQIKLREQQIAQIEERMAPPAIDMDDSARRLVDLVQQQPVEAVTPLPVRQRTPLETFDYLLEAERKRAGL